MDKITEYIVQINCLNYNYQCKYVKKKLLSVDFRDISVFQKVTSNITETTCLFNRNRY